MSKPAKEEYNDIPVLYCGRCLSLRVMNDEVMGDYCPDCGSTDIREAHIEEWEKLVKEKNQDKSLPKNFTYGKERRT